MKPFFLAFVALLLAACSGLQPYKDQSVEQLKTIAQHPQDFYNQVVSFAGEIKGLTEDTRLIRLVLKTDIPFYYYATGKGNAHSYELLLVEYLKPIPQMSGLKKGDEIKILARVSRYEKRPNMLGSEIGVLHLTAFALAQRSQKKDWFLPTSPEKELYEAWKAGRLFYTQTADEIIALYPPAPAPQAQPASQATSQQPAPKNPAAHEIMYDEEEDFVLE